ncbi:MAG: hypothetical protein HPZ89_01790 [Oscillospiraceae bacterium]|nr:hypothetical protein [Oscillospiraceae bacterium]
MKKLSAALAVFAAVWILSGCGAGSPSGAGQTDTAKPTQQQSETGEPAQRQGEAGEPAQQQSGTGEPAQRQGEAGEPGSAEKSWTKEEIHSLFTAAGYDKSPSVTFIDAVVIPDLAYGRVGAVLFTDDETRTVKVMFLDADGNGQTAGPCAKPCAESELTYCGDGTVSFKLETEEGTAYTYWLSLAIDGSHVKFSARDNLDDVVK